jgi:two-component system, LuxR family, sensor kinase FixL
MPWIEALTDPRELRHCIRDLVALSRLPAIWKSSEPHQIADSIAAALVLMLEADFVFIAAPQLNEDAMIEIVHTGRPPAGVSSGRICTVVREALAGRTAGQTPVIANPFGPGTLRCAISPIGIEDNAVLAAASAQPRFPTERQPLLLRIGANEVTIALQRWRAEADQRRFITLIERSSEFIGVAGLDGSAQYLNPAGPKLVGLSALGEIGGMNILDFVAPEERAHAREEYWPKAMQTGRWVGELRFRHLTTGEAIPFLVDWFRIDHPHSEEPINIAALSRDLRAQKVTEAELRRLNETLEQRVAERTSELADANNRLVMEIAERERADARLQELQLELFHAARLSAAGQMAAALAHELTQPLTATVNSVNAARRLLAKGDREMIETIGQVMHEAAGSALRAGQIIHRMRDFVARGNTEKRVERVTTMIKEASALALTRSGAPGVQVRFRFDRNAARVLADRVQIRQVLVNLMRNAVEAMGASSQRQIALTTTLLDPETVEIAVADSGSGIAENVIPHIFEPFVSTRRNGMGLGLSICRSIVEAHGGTLRAEPNPGGGTIFRFTLTAAPRDGETDVT